MQKLNQAILSIIFIALSSLFIASCSNTVSPDTSTNNTTTQKPIEKPSEENSKDENSPQNNNSENIPILQLKEIIRQKTTKIDKWGMSTAPLPGDYEYSKPGTNFTKSDYTLLMKPDESIELYLKDKDGNIERNVKWFVDSRTHYNPNLNLFSPSETTIDNGAAWNSSPVILTDKGDGGAVIKSTSRFFNTDIETNGYIVAVVDGKYVHKKSFMLLKQKELDQLAKHNEIEARVKELSEPLMKYSDIEKAFLLNKTVCENLRYEYNTEANDYNSFVLRKAVCGGYSKMMRRLGQEIGINTIYLQGSSSAGFHAWNAIKLEDGYYYIDSTWNDNDSFDHLTYFFMPKEDFEGERGGLHEPKLINETFGTKYLNSEDKYYDDIMNMATKFSTATLTPSNNIPVPDLEHVTFIGTTDKAGLLSTTETGIEYNTGDGIWKSLTPGVATEVTNIEHKNLSVFAPDNNANITDNPYYILLRRRSGNSWSNNVKFNVYKKSLGPYWIEAENGNIKYINTSIEYKPANTNEYIEITSNDLKLPPGTYDFRIKGSPNYFASDSCQIIVE